MLDARNRLQRGGGRCRVELDEALPIDTAPPDLVALDAALSHLEQHDPTCAEIVQLRYFAGLTMPEVADALGLTLRTAQRNWTYAASLAPSRDVPRHCLASSRASLNEKIPGIRGGVGPFLFAWYYRAFLYYLKDRELFDNV